MQVTNCRTLAISNSASGDTVIIAAPGGAGSNVNGTGFGDITVWGVDLQSTAGNTIQFKSGSSLISGTFVVPANGTEKWLPCGVPFVKCAAGQALSMNLASTNAVTGQIWWTLG